MNREELEKRLAERIRNSHSAVGRLLLFRYLDFNVEPGHVYRYRVRLTIANPNFRKPLEDVIDPSVAEGRVRNTPWSDPSPPAYVEHDTRVFLAGIRDRYGLPTPEAIVELYQWNPDVGTTVQADLRLDVGAQIAGEKRTEVLRPVKQTFEQEEVDLKTDQILADLAPISQIDEKLHADLEITPQQARDQLDLINQAVVATTTGELEPIDPLSGMEEKTNIQRRVQAERNITQTWTQPDAGGGRRGDDDYGRGSRGDRDNPAQKRRNRRR